MLRALAVMMAAILLQLSLSERAHADLQSDISAACTTGGTVTIPPFYLATATINLKCPGGTTPVALVGSPSRVQCTSSANPCIDVGSTDGTSRFNLSAKSIFLDGPGRTVAGSTGMRVQATADGSTFENIKVDKFDLGIHLDAPVTNLLSDVFFTTTRVGLVGNSANPSVNRSVHLDGFMGNIHFTNFHFAAQSQVLVFDGPAGNGADASFTEGTFNVTRTPGDPAVEVSVSDAGQRILQISNIQDWETAVPYLEMGNATTVVLDGIGISGDPFQTPQHPAFHIAPGAFSMLTISNSHIRAQANGANLMKLETTGSMVKILGSRIDGVINFVTPTPAILVGNWCQYAPTGNTAALHASANIGPCPDQ